MFPMKKKKSEVVFYNEKQQKKTSQDGKTVEKKAYKNP